MATGKTCYPRPNHRFLTGDLTAAVTLVDSVSDFDESDVFFSSSARSDSPEFRKPARLGIGRKPSSKRGDRLRPAAPSSLPVNIPDWSKILREEYGSRRRGDSLDNDFEDDDDVEDEEDGSGSGGSGSRLPPHEFLARQMARTRIGIGSFSVHEGVGRTLKGRDLSRVRNAIWARTGFQD